MANGIRHPGSFGVRRPDRSVRIPPGSFTQDPGMRARDEFTDVTSRGYNENAKRVAEGGGAKEYATSVEEEGGKKRADEIRNLVLMTLVALTTYGGATGRLARPAPPPGRYEPQPIRNNMLNRWTARREMRRPHTEVTVDMDAWAQQRPPAQVALGERLKWQPSEGYGQLRGNVGGLLGRHRPSGIGDPGLYRSSGGMSVPEDVLKAIEAVSRQAFKGVITPEELRVALWEIERRATPLGLSTRIGGPYRGGTPPGGIHN